MLKSQVTVLACLVAIASVQIAKGAPSTEEPEELISQCQQPKDAGECDKNETKYYFNSESQECEEFTYGGCNGNDNKFDSMSECNEACGSESEDENMESAYRTGFDPEEESEDRRGYLGGPEDFDGRRGFLGGPESFDRRRGFFRGPNDFDARRGFLNSEGLGSRHGYHGYPYGYDYSPYRQGRREGAVGPESRFGFLHYSPSLFFGHKHHREAELARRGYLGGPEETDKKYGLYGHPGGYYGSYNPSYRRRGGEFDSGRRFGFLRRSSNDRRRSSFFKNGEPAKRYGYPLNHPGHLGHLGLYQKKLALYGDDTKKKSSDQSNSQAKKGAETGNREAKNPDKSQENYFPTIFFKKHGPVFLPFTPLKSDPLLIHPYHDLRRTSFRDAENGDIPSTYKSVKDDTTESKEISDTEEIKGSSENVSTPLKEGSLFRLLKNATPDSSNEFDDDDEDEDEDYDLKDFEVGNKEKDICSLPLKTGNCKAGVERYFFDQDKKECVKFSYRGCDGNENNFETKRDCEIKCIASKKVSKSEGQE